MHILFARNWQLPFFESAEGKEWLHKIFHDQSPRKNVADVGEGWTRDLLVSSRTAHPTEPPRPAASLSTWRNHGYLAGRNVKSSLSTWRNHGYLTILRVKSSLSFWRNRGYLTIRCVNSSLSTWRNHGYLDVRYVKSSLSTWRNREYLTVRYVVVVVHLKKPWILGCPIC